MDKLNELGREEKVINRLEVYCKIRKGYRPGSLSALLLQSLPKGWIKHISVSYWVSHTGDYWHTGVSSGQISSGTCKPGCIEPTHDNWTITPSFWVGKPTARTPRSLTQLSTKMTLESADRNTKIQLKAKTAPPFPHQVGIKPRRQRPKCVITTKSKWAQSALGP